jgi:hypothetical protein
MSADSSSSTYRNVPTVPQAGKIGDDSQARGVRTHQHYRDEFVGDGVKTVFFLSKTPSNSAQLLVFVAGLLKLPAAPGAANDYSLSGNRLTFAAAPAAAAKISCPMVSS